MSDTKLLDCTLRDGGYINDWRWGFAPARDIIRTLTQAGTDVVEVGFLRNVEGYDPDVTVCSTIEELNRLLPADTGHTMYSGMAMRSNYDVSRLSEYSGRGIELIRITAHEYDIREGMDFAREVKARGYKLSINPINIMGYSDRDLLWILEEVNRIHPWQFSIVDTFGSMRRRDLDRIVSLADHNLAPDIRLGLHLHENMALSFCLAQQFLDRHLSRGVTVDASLMGMGRIPGNLPIELVADFVNEMQGTRYDIDELMDAIQDHIAPLKGDTAWGYTPAYFLSARFNLHRNYAEHYLNKGDLTNRDINHILSGIDPGKKAVFDAAYADRLYAEYQRRTIDDGAALQTLRTAFAGKTVLVLAPGASLGTEAGRAAVAAAQADCVVSANFVPDLRTPDYAFFTNSKRYG
ncbi:MAG: aldolase catalytic domain-containing protein, partial [Gemmiger sp.]